jgi:hypothetical protein
VHAMGRDDADDQYDDSFYADWKKGSPQGTSLCGDVILPLYPPYTIWDGVVEASFTWMMRHVTRKDGCCEKYFMTAST